MARLIWRVHRDDEDDPKIWRRCTDFPDEKGKGGCREHHLAYVPFSGLPRRLTFDNGYYRDLAVHRQ